MFISTLGWIFLTNKTAHIALQNAAEVVKDFVLGGLELNRRSQWHAPVHDNGKNVGVVWVYIISINEGEVVNEP